MPSPDPEIRKKAQWAFNHKGSGKFHSDMPYADTVTLTELMVLRGYQLVDGKWVP